MTDDKHLLFLIKNGDREAFDKLFRRWYPSLVAYAGQFINREDAEDVVQDIMFNLWKNALTLTIRSDVSAYLYSAVKNRCLNYIDKAAVRDYGGHFVIRVSPGGSQFYVYKLRDTDFSYSVEATYGPYSCH